MLTRQSIQLDFPLGIAHLHVMGTKEAYKHPGTASHTMVFTLLLKHCQRSFPGFNIRTITVLLAVALLGPLLCHDIADRGYLPFPLFIWYLLEYNTILYQVVLAASLYVPLSRSVAQIGRMDIAVLPGSRRAFCTAVLKGYALGIAYMAGPWILFVIFRNVLLGYWLSWNLNEPITWSVVFHSVIASRSPYWLAGLSMLAWVLLDLVAALLRSDSIWLARLNRMVLVVLIGWSLITLNPLTDVNTEFLTAHIAFAFISGSLAIWLLVKGMNRPHP